MDVAISWALATFCLTVLIPINGLIYIGIRKERERCRKILMGYWQLRNRTK